MSNDLAIYLSKQLLWHALLIAAPVILVALISGLLISILQVVTQIQDSSLSFVPKILAVVLMLMLCGGWMLHSLVEFAQTIILNIPEAIKS
ncbi:MAG: flagellar biosynthesis protein FliQ [Legionella sp.]|nr:flagellar biosynthesis protein FliQ [Legionella sp.]